MPALKRIINMINSLVGDRPFQAPDYEHFSLKEVFTWLGYPKNPLLGNVISVRNLAKFLQNAPPRLPSLPTSLRQMLTS
jgi:hypothetical protein